MEYVKLYPTTEHKSQHLSSAYIYLREAVHADSTRSAYLHLANLFLDEQLAYRLPGDSEASSLEKGIRYLQKAKESRESEDSSPRDPAREDIAVAQPPEDLLVKYAKPSYINTQKAKAMTQQLERLAKNKPISRRESKEEQDASDSGDDSEASVGDPSSREEVGIINQLLPSASVTSIATEEMKASLQGEEHNGRGHHAISALSSLSASSESSMQGQEFSIGLPPSNTPTSLVAEDEPEDKGPSNSNSTSSSEDDDDSSPVTLISKSLPVSGALQEAFAEALKEGKITDALKSELEIRYPNTKEHQSSQSKVSLDEIRLILFLKEDGGLSYTKISELIFFKGKITDLGIRRIVVSHGKVQPEILKEVYDEAMESKTFTENLKNELKERYPNIEKLQNRSKISLDEARLILFLKKDRDFSCAKISNHIFLKGKIKEMAIGKFMHANGIAKRSQPEAIIALTDKRKHDIFTAYLAINAQKKGLSRRQIGIAIASHLHCAEPEIISQLTRLIHPKDKHKRYSDAPSITQGEAVLERYTAGDDFSKIQEATKLSFSAIARIIMAEIPDKELKADFQVALPETNAERDGKIVALYRTLTTPKGPPPISRIVEQTGHSPKICRQALEAAGLVKKQQSAERLVDEGKKEQIQKYWQANLEQWEKKKVILMDRYKEVAQYFTDNYFKVTKAQVQVVCHKPPARKSKRKAVGQQRSQDSTKGSQNEKRKAVIEENNREPQNKKLKVSLKTGLT